MPDTIKIELTSKNLKNRNPPQTIVAMPQVLLNYGQQQSTFVTLRKKFRTKVVTISLLATMCRQGSRFDVTCRCFVVNGRWQRLPTKLWWPQNDYRDGLARHGNVKEMRVAVSNEIWMESQRIVCRHKLFNMLKICRRTRRINSDVSGRYQIRQRQLTATHDD